MQSIPSRISEIRKFQDGWMDGKGHAFGEEVLMLAHQMCDFIESSGQEPHIYPTLEGTIQIEWDDDYSHYDIVCDSWPRSPL